MDIKDKIKIVHVDLLRKYCTPDQLADVKEAIQSDKEEVQLDRVIEHSDPNEQAVHILANVVQLEQESPALMSTKYNTYLMNSKMS